MRPRQRQIRAGNNIQSTNKRSFSNLDKFFWNETKDHIALTKGDLIDYYDKISEYILPYLKDRPLSLSRYPDGALGKHFYHKNWDKSKPEYVETVKVYSESSSSSPTESSSSIYIYQDSSFPQHNIRQSSVSDS